LSRRLACRLVLSRRDARTTIAGPADEHGARAAVPLGTHNLRAGELEMLAEERRERDEGGGAADFEAAAVDVEEDVVSHDFATGVGALRTRW